MGVYIKNWSLADWKELLMWAKIGANNAMIGEFTEAEEVPPHGRLIDADALCEGRVSNDNVVICAQCAPTIIPAEEGE